MFRRQEEIGDWNILEVKFRDRVLGIIVIKIVFEVQRIEIICRFNLGEEGSQFRFKDDEGL